MEGHSSAASQSLLLSGKGDLALYSRINWKSNIHELLIESYFWDIIQDLNFIQNFKLETFGYEYHKMLSFSFFPVTPFSYKLWYPFICLEMEELQKLIREREWYHR